MLQISTFLPMENSYTKVTVVTLNTISVFSIFPTGKLAFVSKVSTLGEGPRNFAIDPTGKYLLVANQRSNEVVIFNRDETSGALTDSGKRIAVGAPVNLCSTITNSSFRTHPGLCSGPESIILYLILK